MRDPAANFAAYRTFGWAPTAAPGGDDQPLQLLDKNIRAAIATEMQRQRVHAESQDNPDVGSPMRQQRPTGGEQPECASESASAAGAA